MMTGADTRPVSSSQSQRYTYDDKDSPLTFLIISCSLHPNSRSYLMAQEAETALTTLGHKADRVQLIDLREIALPLCTGSGPPSDPDHDAPAQHIALVTTAIRQASAVILALPVYNFSSNAAAKNLIEWTSRAWQNKLVGFLCAAGGHSGYMAPMGLAQSLMLDFRCLIVPRFVYATGSDFEDQAVASEQVRSRILELCRCTSRLADALAPGDWDDQTSA